MKKTKVIIPALGMLLLSTAASVTGTVAWFSANASVDANGMKVKVAATYGIVISNAVDGTYAEAADSAITACSTLAPGSTYDLAHWVYSTSDQSNAANSGKDYTPATAWTTANPNGNYVIHNFWVKASANEELAVQSFDITQIDVVAINPETGAELGAPSQALSKSIRVGIKAGTAGTPFIYAPISGYTASYAVATGAGPQSGEGAVTKETVTPKKASDLALKDTEITAIPANNAESTPLNVQVFVWFEGEDANCMSANIVSNLETIKVSARFSYTPRAS